MDLIDLYTPSGIGDIYWILQKLARAANAEGKRFRIHTPPGNGDKFARGRFLEFIDCVESVTPDGIAYNDLVKRAVQYHRLQPSMFCECNTWLEAGNRLEFYMPAFPTEFVLNWRIDDEARREAQTYIKPDVKNIVVYTSGVANNESASTGRWNAAAWVSRIRDLRRLDNVRLIWIGANYDQDILKDIRAEFDAVLIDRPADVVLSLLRLCDGFISYQSGLSCITVAEQIPTLMLYFRKIEKLSTAINPPGGSYRPVFFDDLPGFTEWANGLPVRIPWAKRPGERDYTFWVNENVEKTEADWLANPWVHDDQYESIKHLDKPGEALVEFGCGSGQLARRIRAAQYLGIDQSEPLLRLAREKNAGLHFERHNIREVSGLRTQHVCAFGFLKHFSLAEHDDIFARLASFASHTLTIEMPIRAADHEDAGHDFPHSWVTDARMRENAAKNGFRVVRVLPNRSGEMIYCMARAK